MCGLKAAQIHERPFRAAKDHVQPLAALDSFLPNAKKKFSSGYPVKMATLIMSLFNLM